MDLLMNAANAANTNEGSEIIVANIRLKSDKDKLFYNIKCDVLCEDIVNEDDINKNMDNIVTNVFNHVSVYPTFKENPNLIQSLRVSSVQYVGVGLIKVFLEYKHKENVITAEMRAEWCKNHCIQYIVLDEFTEQIIGFMLSDNTMYSIHDAVVLSLDKGNGILFVREYCGEFMFTICVEEKHGRKIPYFKMHSKEKLVERYPDIFVLGTVSSIKLSDNKSLVNTIEESDMI